MKIKVFLFALFFMLGNHGTFGFVPGLLEQGRKMVGLIEEARTCSVSYKGEQGRLNLCTGLVLEKDDIKFLKELQFNSCQKFLVQMGYKVHSLANLKEAQAKLSSSNIEGAVLEDFFNSTKLAWILHREKVILFKPEARRGDCLHEVLHFYQRQRPRKSALAPLNRKREEQRLQNLLEKAVLEVEKVEKKGDQKKAGQMAAKLQPFIALQREWQRLIDWLDEKEVYQTFFDFPQLFLLNDRDHDIALANLVRLKDSLPWGLKERVLYEAQVALNKKYAQIKTPKGLGGFKSEDEYGANYKAGKMSRDEYEAKVIAMRKYKAWKQVKEARRKGNLLETLKGLGLARQFGKKVVATENLQHSFSYQLYKELPSIKVEGETFIVDTGANDSVMPPKMLLGLKESEVTLLGLKRLQTVLGSLDQAPLIQVKSALKVGEHQIKGLTFTVSELGLPGISGILGMDFFNHVNAGKWQWDFHKKRLGPLKESSFSKTYYLQANGRDIVDALEFKCQQKVKVRLDSGSQVWGDIPIGLDEKSALKCLPNLNKKEILKAPRLSALFSRNVNLNVGFSYLQGLEMIAFDTQKREFYLREEKK